MRRQTDVLTVVVLLAGLSGTAVAQPDTASRLHWVTDGNATTGAVIGDTLYIGGDFTRVAPARDALGSLYGVSASTGQAVRGFPLVNGRVRAVEPDGLGGLYLGGDFDRIGESTSRGFAHLLANGALDSAFAPPRIGPTGPIARGDAALFISNSLDLRAIDPATGALLPWTRAGGGFVIDGAPIFATNHQIVTIIERDVDVSVAVYDQATGALVRESVLDTYRSHPRVAALSGSHLIVTSLVDEGPNHVYPCLLVVDLATGAVDRTWQQFTAWTSDIPPIGNRSIRRLLVSGSTVYVAGEFTHFAGQPRANLAAIDIPSVTLTPWAPVTDGLVDAMAPSPGGIVVAGSFAMANGLARRRLAELDAAGMTTGWQSPVTPRAVETLTPLPGDTLVVGGRMAVAGGIPRAGLAAFDLATDTLLPWAPASPGVVRRVVTSGRRVFVGTEARLAAPSLIQAYDADTGAALPWPLDTSHQQPSGVVLRSAHDGKVYLAGLRSGSDVRVDGVSAQVDEGWPPDTSLLGVGGERLYVATPTGIRAIDARTGVPSPWSISVPRYSLGSTGATSATVNGASVYVSTVTYWESGSTYYGGFAFDGVSAQNLPSGGAGWNAVSVDGRLFSRWGPQLLEPVRGNAVMAEGWSPDLTDIDAWRVGDLFVTPTDLVVLGVEGVWPTPVQGVAVFARRPPVTPHALHWRAVGPRITFSWTPPEPPPPGYVVEAGSGPGLSDLARVAVGPATTFTATAPNGAYYVRVRPDGTTGPAAQPTNEVHVVIGCDTVPAAPSYLTARLAGSLVTIEWQAPAFDAPEGYVLEAGSAEGRTDIASVTLGPDATSFSAAAPPGTYYVRLRAINACGQSERTPDVFVSVGTTEPIPEAPERPSAIVSNHAVALQWPAVAHASSYRLEVGSAPQRADLGIVATGATSLAAPMVPAGHYFVRVRAVGRAGLGPSSPELVVTVPE